MDRVSYRNGFITIVTTVIERNRDICFIGACGIRYVHPSLSLTTKFARLAALVVYAGSWNRFRERLSFIHGGRYLAFSLSDECRLINGVWLPRLSLVSIAASRQTRQSLRAQSLWKRGRNEGFSGNTRRGLVTELARQVFTWRRERYFTRRTVKLREKGMEVIFSCV